MSDVIRALEASRDEFVDAAKGVPEALATTKPGEGRWSVLDCVEHIVFSEGRLGSWLETPLPEPAPPADQEKEAMLVQRVAARITKAQAPEASHPTGRFENLAHALDEFRAVRARSIQFAQEKGAGLYKISAKHPFFGPINGTEVLLLAAAHSRRHAAQMREIKDQLASA